MLFYLAVASLVVPSILISLGIGLVFQQSGHGARTGTAPAFGAHLTWTLPFGVLIMFAVFNRFSPAYEEAARDLGATPWQTFRHVVLPIIAPSLIGVGLFGFTLSYDEFARTLMTAGTFNTLPLEIYGMTTNVTTPVLYALGTVTTGFSFLVIALALVSLHPACAAAGATAATPARPHDRRRAQGTAACRRRPELYRAARFAPSTRRDRSRDHRRHRRQDRGQRLRQRLHPRLCHPRLKLLLAERLKCPTSEVEGRVAIVMSGGTEGGLSPHLLVFCRETGGGARRWAAARHRRRPDARLRARGDRPRPADRGDSDAVAPPWRMPASPSPATCTSSRSNARCSPRSASRRPRGAAPRWRPRDTYHSMALSRGASALGVALALGEIPTPPEAAVCRDWSLFFEGRQHLGRRGTSAQRDRRAGQLRRPGRATLVIDHDVMKDAIDAAPRAVSLALGGETVAVLAKAEAAPSGEIRGRRHTMLDDSDIHSTRHARALVGGVLAGVIGDTLLYVSGGAEHQGPAGGGPVAIIGRV